jgi:glycosyltransferase involved in cell wall biosynthesis
VTKKVAIIGTVGLPAKYGGFETLAEYLTKYLGNRFDLTVYCSSKSYEKRLEEYNGAKLEYVSLNANGVQSILYDIVTIFKALRYADALLVLGVSGCIVLPVVKLISSKKVVVNIDGLEWKRAKWSKFAKWFLRLSEKLAVKYADVVVTDNKVIQDYILSEYAKESALIAYGADHVAKVEVSQELLASYPFLSKPYAFSVCRIEPENNLHIILEAMAMQDALPMVIVGNWDASQYGRELRTKYAGFKNLYMLDPIYDQQILNQVRSNCSVYLHGHSAGGTNPSLVEAMILGSPIYAFNVDYNKETTEHSAQYFSNADELVGLLAEMDAASLSAIGQQMAEIANRRYQWKAITDQYAALLDS